MPGKPALIAEGVGYVLDSDVSRIRKQRPEADAGISGDGAMGGHTTQKITPDTLGTIPHPLLFLISGRPKGGVSGAVADRAAISVAVTGTFALHSRCLCLRPASTSAASNLAGPGLRALGRHFDRSLSSKGGRRRTMFGAPLPVRLPRSLRLRAPSPSASSRSAADAPGPPKRRGAPRGVQRCRRNASRLQISSPTTRGHLPADPGGGREVGQFP